MGSQPGRDADLDPTVLERTEVAGGRDGEETQTAPRGARWLSPAPRAVPGYEVGPVLGAGGMGEVLAAHDPRLRRRVALKRLKGGGSGEAGLAKRFVEEAQVTAQLDHPNIVPVYELGREPDGRPYYTMKEVRGEDLAKVIGSGSRTMAQLLRVFVKVCDAVAFAHSRGVLHRDLKPANVMVGEFGEVYVMDWGLAKSVGPEGAAGATGILGTPAYMAPEQREGNQELDARTDVYLLGGILYEILTGDVPHGSESGPGLVLPPSRRTPERAIPREIEAIAMKALALAPDDRYASAAAMGADVEAYLDGRLVGAARYNPLAAAWKWAKRQRKPLLAAGAAVLLVLGLSLGWARVERARSLAGLRDDLAALAPEDALAEAKRALADVPDDPVRRESPTPLAKRERARLLERLRQVSFAQGEVLRADPDATAVRRARFETLVALGRLAEANEDYTLAEFNFGEAEALGVDDETARGLQERVEKARRALLARHEKEILALLGAAERGDLAGEDAFDVALVGIVSLRERQTADLLLARLREITDLLRETIKSRVLSVKDPTPEERQELRWEPIAGLEEAVEAYDRYFAPGEAGPVAPDPRQIAAVSEALERIEIRDARGRGQAAARREYKRVFAEAEQLALHLDGRDRERVLALACDALGLLGETEGVVEALGHYLWWEWDDLRATRAGRALARLAGPGSEVARTLLDLVADPAGLEKWSADSAFWRIVKPAVQASPGTPDGPSPRSAEESYLRGTRRQEAGDHRGAIEDFDRAIELDPDHPEFYNNRAFSLRSQGDLAGACRDMDRAVRRATYRRAALAVGRGEMAWYLANRASFRYEAGKAEAALADAERALELSSRCRAAWSVRGAIRSERGDAAGAMQDLTRAIELDPVQFDAWNARGMAGLAAGDLDGAIADFDRAIAIDEKDARPVVNRGLARYRKKDHDGAITDFTRALEVSPGLADAHGNRGMAYMDRGDLDLAIADFDRAIELDGKDAVDWSNRGLARRQQGDLSAAIADFDRALAIDGGSAQVWANRGQARSDAGDPTGGRADCDRAIELDSTLALAWHNRAGARWLLGDAAGALADYERALALAPDEALTWSNRGWLRLQQGDVEGAIADISRAVEIDPSLAAAHVNLGDALVAKEDLEAAIRSYDRAIEIDPFSATAFHNRGQARYRKGDLAAAIADYDRSLAVAPRSAMTFNNRAEARWAKGDRDLAMADVERAIELDPELVVARYNRGYARAEMGDAAGAADDFTWVLAREPNHYNAAYYRGLVRFHQGEVGKAIADFTLAIESGAEVAPAYNDRGFARATAGDLDGAIADYTRALEIDPAYAAGYINRGHARYQQGDLGAAAADLAKALSLEPSAEWSEKVRGELGQVEKQLAERREKDR